MTLGSAKQLSSINLINIEKLTYDSLIIRENTKITLNFIATVDVPIGSYVMIMLNYLGDEIVRKFRPFCFLTRSTEFVDSAERCYFVGNRLEARANKVLVRNVMYTFILDDIPNPDFGYKEPESIAMQIVSSDRLDVISISTEMVINYEKQPFVKRDIAQIIDYVGIVDGTLEVPQGFYSTIDISPVVIDPLKETPFFLDEVRFALGDI